MDVKKMFFALLTLTLLLGGVCAASVNDFNVGNNYKNVYRSDYYLVNSNDKQDCGVLIFQNVDDDVYDDRVNDDVLDHVIHHDGREYIVQDDDMKISKNPDHTANFTDYDHAVHGVSEVIKVDGKEFIVAFWAKDSANINDNDLSSQLNDFNKNNNAEVVAF